MSNRFEEHFEDNLVVVKEKKALLNFMERSIVCVDPAESWLDVSTTHLFEFYAGDQTANWRERGFSTVLDVLLVSLKSKFTNFSTVTSYHAYRNAIQILTTRFQL